MAQRRPSEATSLVATRAVDVLIAEDNPISQKILETLLTRMGCRCVCVNDGAEALAASMGTIRECHAERQLFSSALLTSVSSRFRYHHHGSRHAERDR